MFQEITEKPRHSQVSPLLPILSPPVGLPTSTIATGGVSGNFIIMMPIVIVVGLLHFVTPLPAGSQNHKEVKCDSDDNSSLSVQRISNFGNKIFKCFKQNILSSLSTSRCKLRLQVQDLLCDIKPSSFCETLLAAQFQQSPTIPT